MLPPDDFINLINIKKEIPDADDAYENLISSSELASNPTDYLINIKSESANIQSLNNDDSASLSEISSVRSSIGINLNRFLTPIVKQEEKTDIKSEMYDILDSTSTIPGLETSLISVKEESYDELANFENYSSNEDATEPKKINCNICGKDFSTEQKLERHRREVHGTKNYICHLCNKGFVMSYLLKKHERLIHLKIRDWKCTGCDKSFGTKQELQNHEQIIHLNMQIWKCMVCDTSFSTKSNLQRHEKTVHLKRRDWKCTKCDKFLSSQRILKHHERTVHLKIRNWKCMKCDKSLCTKQALELHKQRVHLNNRDHQCTMCEKSFNMKLDLKRHERRVHLMI